MTEGISQEAQALFKELERFAVAGRDYSPILDGEAIEVIEAAMQSLINSTIERCAAVADALEAEMDAEFQSGREQEVGGMAIAACNIALDIRKMKGSTNV